MSAEAKRVKILTLIELFLGLIVAVRGLVVGLGGTTQAPFVLAAEGVVSLVFGVRGALIANVPARMNKMVSLAAAILVLQLACVAGMIALMGPDNVGSDPVGVVGACVMPLTTLVVLILARGMAKRAER